MEIRPYENLLTQKSQEEIIPLFMLDRMSDIQQSWAMSVIYYKSLSSINIHMGPIK